MNVDDELIQALRALRALDLPPARHSYLHRVLIHAPTSADRQRIVTEARQEVARNAYKARAAIERAFDEQREREALNRAQKPRKAPTKVTEDHRRHVHELRQAGLTLHAISEQVDLAPSTIYRLLSDPPGEQPVNPANARNKKKPSDIA